MLALSLSLWLLEQSEVSGSVWQCTLKYEFRHVNQIRLANVKISHEGQLRPHNKNDLGMIYITKIALNL